MTRKMRKMLVYVFTATIALTLFSVRILSPATEPLHVRSNHRPQATDAAFRDGLYLGKLQARQGREPHLSVGRWSGEADRGAFVRGYERGYAGVLQEFAERNAAGGARSRND